MATLSTQAGFGGGNEQGNGELGCVFGPSRAPLLSDLRVTQHPAKLDLYSLFPIHRKETHVAN